MSIPTNEEILALLDRLDAAPADDLESDRLDFKPWTDPKTARRVAIEYVSCFANAEGGAVVFGVHDQVQGRAEAIHGAKRYDLDEWRRALYAAIRPNLEVSVEEISIPEGTGKLLVVRVPRGPNPPYGTAEGLYKKRVGKNCMPLDPLEFTRARVATGAIDWSGERAEGVSAGDLDPLEIQRARALIRRANPASDLLKVDDAAFLVGLGAVRGGEVTHTGLLLFGREETLAARCPQHQVHFVYQVSETAVARNDSYRMGLLQILERIEQAFSGPTNPEEELSLGLFKLRIPAYPLDVVREAILNAVTHRDYLDPGEVLIRQTQRELVVMSPGGFIGGITTKNILRHEPVSRNRTLAEAFEKLRLVERAGVGRRRIFIPVLSFGKRPPQYESDGQNVVLRIYDGSYDRRMASLVANWQAGGREVGLDALLVLTYMRGSAFIDTVSAAEILQVPRRDALAILDQLAQPGTGILERRGRTRAATYHLCKGVAKDLLGKAAYTKTKGLQPIRYEQMVRVFVQDHGHITPAECRELLGLGDSQSARVDVSRYLKKWSGTGGFLQREGTPPRVRYLPVTGC